MKKILWGQLLAVNRNTGPNPNPMRTIFHSCGINSYRIVGNSSKVHQMIKKSNEQKNVENIATYDFSTLYTNIPHDKLKTRMADVISKAYEGSGKTYISVYSTSASFVNKHKKDTKAYTKDQLIEMIGIPIGYWLRTIPS